MLFFDRYGCMFMQRHARAKSKKYVRLLPVEIKLALSCTIYVTGFAKTRNNPARTEIHFIA